ncbi:protein Cep89 homolog [Uranotaenia lowii]|uniref:protein Cep89 homolog n=1 Tax=Uranotaenia lowii TaxID=190385 RepID=UPI00247A7101|nr:protein Cep89 homolog [Uranotaenia lowii]XP_055597021.1 protein Cep89 homolog [Uranotaenia lowii]
MSSKLPTRKNIEPVMQIVSDLDKNSLKTSSSSFPRHHRRKPHKREEKPDRDDDEEEEEEESDDLEASKKSDRFHFRRRHHKSRIPGPAATYVGQIVCRSKSVDDLMAGNDVEAPREEKRVSHVEHLIKAKDHQIAKLVEKITTLFECNSQFATENEKLQKDYLELQQNMKALQSMKAKSCESCAEFENDRELLAKENSDLRNDVKMMKILVYRLNVQVERYQDVIRESKSGTEIPKIDFVDSSYGGNRDNLNWGPVHSHTLGPLLNAYEETIAEKNDLVQQYERELINFTGKLKKVLEENEKLHKDMEEIKSTQSSWLSDKARLQAQVDVFKTKAEIQGKRADLAKEKLVEVLKCYEQKIQAQCLDIERLQEAYARSKGELTSLRHLNQKPEIVADSLKECQKLFEEMKIQHDSEKTRLSNETDSLKSDIAAKNEEISKLKSEISEHEKIYERQKEINEALMEKNSALRQSLSRTRQSKEVLKSRLKNMITWGRNVEQRRDQLQDSWKSVRALEERIRQREEQLQNLQAHHRLEVDQLQRRLKQREDSLRRILEDKAKVRHV